MIKEMVFNEIVTFEYIMWRKSYISGEIKVLIDIIEDYGKSGIGKIIDVIEVKNAYFYDDYTDLHGGIDSFCKKATLDEVRNMIINKEGKFEYIERAKPPINRFKLKDQIPIDLKPKDI
ncbi:MAG: hypothetical protein LM593_01870 [Candidatus Verstraetearchaeota archaeon]|nr:hypothetical protein [Candidatus Verstraetearchaeota archaeon]